MGMFLVEKGTAVMGVKDGDEWDFTHRVDKLAKETLVFGKEQVVADPVRHAFLPKSPRNRAIAEAYAQAGYYGFAHKGWVVFVRAEHVQYG